MKTVSSTSKFVLSVWNFLKKGCQNFFSNRIWKKSVSSFEAKNLMITQKVLNVTRDFVIKYDLDKILMKRRIRTFLRTCRFAKKRMFATILLSTLDKAGASVSL